MLAAANANQGFTFGSLTKRFEMKCMNNIEDMICECQCYIHNTKENPRIRTGKHTIRSNEANKRYQEVTLLKVSDKDNGPTEMLGRD